MIQRWTDDERIILREEAERQARAGSSRPDISRRLGVPMHTLARWAFEGGWRDKDIAAEQAHARAEALKSRLTVQRAHEIRPAGARPLQPGHVRLVSPALEFKSSGPTDQAPDPAGPQPDQAGPDHVEPGSAEPDSAEPDWASPHPPKPTPSVAEAVKRLRRLQAEEDDCPGWADREVRVKTPPWAPGGQIENPESCALFLASDLMRQGLLVEAGRALRFTRDWLDLSERVFHKRDKEDAACATWQERREAKDDLDVATLAWQKNHGSSSSNSRTPSTYEENG
ncbi:MAG: hypothetical protein Q8R02_21560 [Hyphomonadaceae bacterium]|nr:hypothetical protein [Hyphomonadaceae bacterium]